MSLILEALRKSESERQMGQPPGLMSQAAQMSSPREANRGLLWALAAALVLAIALGAWWLGRQAQSPELPAADPTQPAVPASASPSAATAPAADPAAVKPAEVTPAEAKPAASEPAPQPQAPVAPPAASSVPAPPAPVAGQEPEVLPEPKPEPQQAQSASAADPISRPDIGLMPSSERSQLPPLKLSVHVYHEDPSRRFAIIDGRRVVGGESLDGGVQVQAIERDGLWLVINGRSWWLPR